MRFGFIFTLLFSLANLDAGQVEVDEILERINQTKNGLIQANMEVGLQESNLVFLTIWNFDETILHGDTTDGLVDGDGKVVFKGMSQMAIEAGFSQKYPAKGGFQKFWNDYQRMEEKDEPKAYAYCAQILAGAKPGDVLKLSTGYFLTTLQPHFFPAAKELLATLQNLDIRTFVITASPRLYVQGAGPLLNIPREQIYGMETVVKDGLLTDQMVAPLTTRQGKVDKIGQIVREIMAKDSEVKKVYVLAGFGNDNANDMVFLKWIAAQKLEAGAPIAVVGFQAPSLPKNFVSLQLVAE